MNTDAGDRGFHLGPGGDVLAPPRPAPGSFYTEPPGENHFAETRESAVLVQITGFGPTGTTYVRASDDPRH